MPKEKQKISGDDLAVGGQAVIEGVMMRSPDKYVVSVRNPKGKIQRLIKSVPKHDGFARNIRKVPFVRGIFALVDSMKIGFKALDYSSNIALEEEKTTNDKVGKKDSKSDPVNGFLMTFTMIFSIAFALFLFKFLPFWLSGFVSNNDSEFVWFEGIIKALIFVGYLLVISLSKDIRNVFRYHGAEHKTIHCYEKFGLKGLNVKNALACSRIHKRCGTTFLFLTIFISILVYAIIPIRFNFWTSFGVRILFLPVIAGISFEILRLVPKLSNKNPLKWVLLIIEYPGLLIQQITTKEPNKKQLAVAIDSLKTLLK